MSFLSSQSIYTKKSHFKINYHIVKPNICLKNVPKHLNIQQNLNYISFKLNITVKIREELEEPKQEDNAQKLKVSKFVSS